MFNFLSSKKLKKYFSTYYELIRFALAFGFAILISIIFSDFPPAKKILFDSILTDWLLFITGHAALLFLDIFRFDYIVDNVLIQIKDTKGVLIVFGCLAYRHIIIFTFFILFYLGKFYHKIWYIVLGLVSLIIVNAFRIFIIAISQIPFPEHTQIIHYYSGRIIMYGTLFILLYIWIRKVNYK